MNFQTLNEWNVRTLNGFIKVDLFVRQNKKRLRNLFSTRKGKFINYIAVSVCQNVQCCHPVKILLNIQSWWRQKWYNCVDFLLRLDHIKITKHLVTFFLLITLIRNWENIIINLWTLRRMSVKSLLLWMEEIRGPFPKFFVFLYLIFISVIKR